MDSTERYKQSLVDWNNLINKNTEDKVVASWHMSTSQGSIILDKFSIWLLVGTGATASLFITQINDILVYLSHDGFIVGMLLLVLSSIAGIIAKHYAITNATSSSMQKKLTEDTDEIFAAHEVEAKQIIAHLEGLKKQGTDLQLEPIDMNKIINTFLEPFPFVTKMIIKRSIMKNEALGIRVSGFLANMAYVHQSWFTAFQTILFILFIMSSSWFSVINI